MNFSTLQKKVVRKSLTLCFELKAKIFGKVFVCKAINGESDYNISINSDMSVSCNCQDYDGSGCIGNLNRSTLKEIFSGEQVNMFRKKLSYGRLPVPVCARCSELVFINKSELVMNKYHVPRKGIMVENTVACDIMCKSCDRKSVLRCRKKIGLNLEDIMKISEEVSKNKIESVCFFNLGEPFLSNNICKELKTLKKGNKKINIIVSTCGLHLDTFSKRKAMKYINHVVFSIDGANNEILRKYQTNGNFDISYKNMKDLVNFRNKNNLRGTIEWKYILFNWNDKKEYINKAIELAKEAGVDKISFWPTGNPFWGISWRYFIKNYFNEIGVKNNKGVIEVKFSC